MEDYGHYDAVGLAKLVRDGEASPAELLGAAKRRRDEVNPKINAVVRDIEPPASRPAADGPFGGVPFLIKDLYQDLAGYPTSNGSKALLDVVRTETDTVVKRWLDAGLVIFGKTNTPEFGAKAVTESEALGPARNPWLLELTPGGSSGGAAAAVAAGIVPCAGASDGGGSIRIPASACGLFGLKASRGLVPAGPQRAENLVGLSTNGVISRSVRDTAVMLDVLVGPAADSPYEAARPAMQYSQEVGRDPGRLRIAVCTASSINPNPHPEAIEAARRTAELLTSLGHEVVELTDPPFDSAAMAKDFLTAWFAAAAFEVAESKELSGSGDSGFEDDTLVMAALGRAVKPVEMIRSAESRHGHTRRLAEFHERYDLLLTPTTATPPPRVGELNLPPALQLLQAGLVRAKAAGVLRWTPIVEDLIDKHLGWVPYTQLANITGRPAMSVPLHWTQGGVPIGSQFVGRLGSEGLLLRLAAQLENAQPWADRRPLL